MIKRFLTCTGLLAICLFGLGACSIERLKYIATTIEAVKLTDRAYVLKGAGGNIGVLIGDDGVLVVDTQHAPLSERILAAIATVSDKPVRHVINTHWHHDHTGGNENFAKAGALIVAHENLRKRLDAKQTLEEWDLEFPALPPAAQPTVTYRDTLSLRVHGYHAELIHPPAAHTDGDTIVFFPSANVIHMGDILATGRFPFIDRGAGGSIKGMIAACETAIGLANDATQVIAGHGELADRKSLVTYVDMLKTARAAIVALIADGRTRQEVIAAQPLAGLAETWGKDFVTADLFAEIVYDTETRP